MTSYKLEKVKGPSIYPSPAYQVFIRGKEAGMVYKTDYGWRLECAIFDFNVIASGLVKAVNMLLDEMAERGF